LGLIISFFILYFTFYVLIGTGILKFENAGFDIYHF